MTVYLDVISPLFAYVKTVVLGEGSRVEYSERERKVLSRKKLPCEASAAVPSVIQILSLSVLRPAPVMEGVFQVVYHCSYID